MFNGWVYVGAIVPPLAMVTELVVGVWPVVLPLKRPPALTVTAPLVSAALPPRVSTPPALTSIVALATTPLSVTVNAGGVLTLGDNGALTSGAVTVNAGGLFNGSTTGQTPSTSR